MADGKKESGPKRWFKSIVEHNSSSSRSEGQASGATSPTTNTASGSAMSLPPSSSEYDSNSLTPTRLTTDAQSNHTAITSGTSPDMPEELIQSRQQQTTATGNARINAQDSQVLHSNAHAVVRDEVTLDRGPTILAPSTVAQELDSVFCGTAGLAKHQDGTGPMEEPHPGGKSERSSQELCQNTPVLENTPTSTVEPQKEPHLSRANLTPPASSAPGQGQDMLSRIHVTIEEIKSAQKALEDKKWYYTDRHGRRVDVGDRMRRILRSVEGCARVVDVAIQHHPEISALVWAGARFILMVALNRVEFMDNLEAAMGTIVDKMATCEFYAHIYDEGIRVRLAASTTTKAFDDGLDSALKDLYAAVGAFLEKAKEYFDPENSVAKKIVNHLKPFSVTMQPLIQDISDKEGIVEKYAGMATMGRIKADSSKLQQVRDVIMQIREEIKPLAKLDEILIATQDIKETLEIRSTEILHVANGVSETLLEFQTQVVQALQPQQREMLSSKPLDSELQELKTRYLAECQQTDIFHANLYVPAQGMATQHAPQEEHFDLWGRLEKFMAPVSPQRVCLIQGAAGAGKSTFNHYLATRLWEAYDKDASSNEHATRPIPVFIPLANLHDPTRHNQDLIAELFKRRKWSEEGILKAREQLKFVFILDGYDEIEKRDRNFYADNQLEEWNAKTIITSRPEYLGSGYQSKFHPTGQPQLLQEYWLAPFSTKDITEYISKYVRVITANDPPEAPSRSVNDYEQLVERPELRALISNPFLLRMVMTVQPSTGEIEFKRVTLYQKFLDHWLRSAQERLSRIQLPSALAGPFNTLCEEKFTEHAEIYCFEFAVTLYRHKSLEATYFPNPGWSAPKKRQNAIWAEFLANDDPKKRLLRYSSPLVRIGESYRFLHKSLRDFAVAQSMLQHEPLCITSALFNEFPIVDDHGIIDFIVEEAKQNQELQAQLLECVEESKQNPEVANAAANAITILVRAGKRFHKYDLRGIRIPGADLRTGWFEGAQLQGADLRRVRWNSIWLRGADLTGACIDDGEFGEKPYFKLEDSSHSINCFYTPEGELLVAAGHFGTHDVTLWSVTTRKLLHTFRGHTDAVIRIAFPPNGDDLLASAGKDKTVRLWSRQSQDVPLVHTFDRHTDWVHKVAFSPDTKFLASGGGDSLVCLWSVATHSLIHSFSYSDWVYSVAFSPDGQTLAAAGRDQLVHLWSTESGKLLQTLQGHTGTVNCITFAPDGQILVSASHDKSLKLWSVLDGKPIHRFTGHAGEIHIVAFAPDSQMIATAATRPDSSVQIWSVASRKLVHVFKGISLPAYQNSGLAFSRDGELIATGATDGTIRQWFVPREVSDSVRLGNSHTGNVNDLAFSYDKKLLASASSDGTVRLWSMDPPRMPTLVNILAPSPARELVFAVTFTPASAFLITSGSGPGVHLYRLPHDRARSSPGVLGTHRGWVWALAMSPNGDTLASASRDSHIYLWSIQSGTKLATLEGHTNMIFSVNFSPDGQLLISGSGDQTVRLWSVPSHRISHIYKGHTGYVRHVAFSPDGETIASASNDRTVRLWSVQDCESLYIFQGHTRQVTRVAFSPDGYLLASGSVDKTLRFWSVYPRELVLNIDIQSEVCALAWTGSTAMSGLIAIGTESGGVQLLQVIHKRGYSRENPVVELSWLWASHQGAYLTVFGAQIEGVTGLNPTNIELLK